MTLSMHHIRHGLIFLIVLAFAIVFSGRLQTVNACPDDSEPDIIYQCLKGESPTFLFTHDGFKTTTVCYPYDSDTPTSLTENLGFSAILKDPDIKEFSLDDGNTWHSCSECDDYEECQDDGGCDGCDDSGTFTDGNWKKTWAPKISGNVEPKSYTVTVTCANTGGNNEDYAPDADQSATGTAIYVDLNLSCDKDLPLNKYGVFKLSASPTNGTGGVSYLWSIKDNHEEGASFVGANGSDEYEGADVSVSLTRGGTYSFSCEYTFKQYPNIDDSPLAIVSKSITIVNYWVVFDDDYTIEVVDYDDKYETQWNLYGNTINMNSYISDNSYDTDDLSWEVGLVCGTDGVSISNDGVFTIGNGPGIYDVAARCNSLDTCKDTIRIALIKVEIDSCYKKVNYSGANDIYTVNEVVKELDEFITNYKKDWNARKEQVQEAIEKLSKLKGKLDTILDGGDGDPWGAGRKAAEDIKKAYEEIQSYQDWLDNTYPDLVKEYEDGRANLIDVATTERPKTVNISMSVEPLNSELSSHLSFGTTVDMNNCWRWSTHDPRFVSPDTNEFGTFSSDAKNIAVTGWGNLGMFRGKLLLNDSNGTESNDDDRVLVSPMPVYVEFAGLTNAEIKNYIAKKDLELRSVMIEKNTELNRLASCMMSVGTACISVGGILAFTPLAPLGAGIAAIGGTWVAAALPILAIDAMHDTTEQVRSFYDTTVLYQKADDNYPYEDDDTVIIDGPIDDNISLDW